MPAFEVPKGEVVEILKALEMNPEGFALEFQNEDTIALIHYKTHLEVTIRKGVKKRLVINEKALLSRMKDAYNGGGYTVAVNNYRHIIIGGAWAMEIDSKNLPRDVIGLLAVHMGYLPESGTAFRITKTKGGPYVQDMIYEDAMAIVESMTGYPVAVHITKTTLTLEGCNVWQQDIGTAVHLIRPDLEDLFRKKEDVQLAGHTFQCVGEISRAWVMEALVDPEDAKMRCLSGIRWTA